MAVDVQELQYRLRGIDELSKPSKKAENSLKNLGNQAKKSQIQMNQFGGSLTGAQKNLRKFALGGVQQAGYQIGDYAVQVANGTSRMQAFGQQAGQFLQIFGPFGAVLGAAVSVISAIVIGQERAAEAARQASGRAKDFTAQTELLRAAMDKLNGTLILNSSNIEQIKKKYGALTADTREYLRLVEDLARIDVIKQTTESFKQLIDTKDYQKIVGELGALKEDIAYTQAGLTRAVSEGLEPETISALKQELAGLEARYASVSDTLDDLPEGKIMRLSEEFLTAAGSSNVDAMKQAVVSLRQEIAMLPADARQAMLPMILQMEGQMRELAKSMEPVNRSIDKTVKAMEPIFDPRHPNYDPIKAEFYKIQQGAEAAAEAVDKVGASMIQLKALAKRKDDEVIFDPRDPRYNRIRAIFAQIQAGVGEVDETAKSGSKSVSNIAQVVRSELSPAMKQQLELADFVGDAFGDSLMSVVDGTKSVKEAFRSMATDIIKELYRVFVVKRITGFISSAFLDATVGPVQGPNLPPRAVGGPVASKTPYLVGERGPEMFIPSSNGRIVANNQLGGGGTVVVNQTINVSTGVQQTVRTEIKSLMPQIAESAKAAVADAKRRGGSYGRAFA